MTVSHRVLSEDRHVGLIKSDIDKGAGSRPQVDKAGNVWPTWKLRIRRNGFFGVRSQVITYRVCFKALNALEQ